MKNKLIIILLTLLPAINSYAQQNYTSEDAKITVEKFMQQIEYVVNGDTNNLDVRQNDIKNIVLKLMDIQGKPNDYWAGIRVMSDDIGNKPDMSLTKYFETKLDAYIRGRTLTSYKLISTKQLSTILVHGTKKYQIETEQLINGIRKNNFVFAVDGKKNKIIKVYLRNNTSNPTSQGTTYSGTIGIHKYVDLGLPSGTLWATCNVGANNPWEFGDYFAWGENQPKTKYTTKNYKYCKGDKYWKITKYCTKKEGFHRNGKIDFYDDKKQLESIDDAATINWGNQWCMPTSNQFIELCDKCMWIWISKKGINGYEVIGPNGNKLFFPASGSRSEWSNYANSKGYYWTREVNCIYNEHSDDSSYALIFDDFNVMCYNLNMGSLGNYEFLNSFPRWFGSAVRPVLNHKTITND